MANKIKCRFCEKSISANVARCPHCGTLIKDDNAKICKDCGYTGHTERKTKGSILIEILLWCFFLVPGIIYSLWRLTTKYDACPSCSSASMIPLNSPQGKKLTKEFK